MPEQRPRPPESRFIAQARGFSLVELSVVVVIIAMLLSMGLGALNAQLVSAGYAETKKRQAILKDALTAYLGANKRLPCPAKADPSATPPVTGMEDLGLCAQSGVVPYASLGLGRELALDGWGNLMSYTLPTGGTPCPGTGVDWSKAECFGAGKGAPYILKEGTVAANIDYATTLIAAIVSHGPNGFGARTLQGSQNPPPGTCEEAHNTHPPSTPVGCSSFNANHFYKGERPENDDVVAYLTRDEAINALAKQGTIKSAKGQIVDDLAELRGQWISSILSPCSSSSTCCTANPPPTRWDPFGNSYTYESTWPHRICSTEGSCTYIEKGDINTVITKMAGDTC